MGVLAKRKFGLTSAEQELLLGAYLPFAELVALPVPLGTIGVRCRDDEDEKFIHLALAGRADVLVTGDADLLVLRGKAPVRIVAIPELKATIQANE